MYIKEAVRLAQNYYPSEYDIKEMYSWCDEVSSMLAIEDRNVYVSVTLIPDANSTILLPEGVGFENVVSVTVGDRVISKENLRYSDEKHIKTDSHMPVRVVYLMPYIPIRVVSYYGAAEFDKDNKRILIKENPFVKGDLINLEVDGVSIGEMSVDDVEFDSESEFEYVLTVHGDELSNLEIDTSELVTINRIVTDKTICDAPYDSMYVDYILAKIGMYQRDYEMYNQFMTSFNSRLDAYKRWIINHLPQDGGKLVNWW